MLQVALCDALDHFRGAHEIDELPVELFLLQQVSVDSCGGDSLANSDHLLCTGDIRQPQFQTLVRETAPDQVSDDQDEPCVDRDDGGEHGVDALGVGVQNGDEDHSPILFLDFAVRIGLAVFH